jgi:nucleotide sugar dehydrogenase
VSGYSVLKERIESKKAIICIVGLGYVGLPLAVAFGKKGYFVVGYDTNKSRIKKLKKGEKYIVDIAPEEIVPLVKKKRFLVTSDRRVLMNSDIIIICVPTPLRKVKIPDISYVVKASRDIVKYFKKYKLIILESTSFPTTTRDVVLPILRKSGLKEEKDFFLCFSPERINPGDNKYPLAKIPKLIGGLSSKSSSLTKILYSQIIDKVVITSGPEIAETAKLLENTFRLVNIALVNEFAILCNKLGISVWEVIEAARTKPFGFMPFYPGCGSGGHCIPTDPLYLSWKAKRVGFKTRMIDLASYINHFMPCYVVKRAETLLKERSILIKKAKILILGVTYKKDVKDLRESPALDIIEELQKKGAKVSYYDPLIPYLKINNINLKRVNFTEKNITRYDCVVILTDHSKVDYEFIRRNANLIFDTRNVYRKGDKSKIVKL